MTTEYSVKVVVDLECVDSPFCRIKLGDYNQEFVLTQPQSIEIDYTHQNSGSLIIEHFGKKDHDPTTALIIKKIKFNELSSERFMWAANYYPDYPAHMTGPKELKSQPYLGWNGKWILNFTMPIYTWIHKIEDLGWIYD